MRNVEERLTLEIPEKTKPPSESAATLKWKDRQGKTEWKFNVSLSERRLHADRSIHFATLGGAQSVHYCEQRIGGMSSFRENG